MGYRSEVKALFYVNVDEYKPKGKKKKEEELALLIHAFFKEHATKENFDYLHDYFTYHSTGVEFYAAGIKWYDGYKDVEAFRKIRNLYDENFCAKDNNPGFYWEFCRIGEDDNDIEKEAGTSGTCGVLYVTHSIEGSLR